MRIGQYVFVALTDIKIDNLYYTLDRRNDITFSSHWYCAALPVLQRHGNNRTVP